MIYGGVPMRYFETATKQAAPPAPPTFTYHCDDNGHERVGWTGVPGSECWFCGRVPPSG